MNFYRNAYFHVQNKMKQHFHTLVQAQLPQFTPTDTTQYTVHYKLYYKNKACDGSNIIALIEKFFLDAIQPSVVPQDSVLFHLGSSWEIVSQDKLNPRVEIEITVKDN